MKCVINGTTFDYRKNFQDNKDLRYRLNRLAGKLLAACPLKNGMNKASGLKRPPHTHCLTTITVWQISLPLFFT